MPISHSETLYIISLDKMMKITFMKQLILGGTPNRVTLPWATYNNILRSLIYAMEFFDNDGSLTIDAGNIDIPGKMSVINVTGEKGIRFAQ